MGHKAQVMAYWCSIYPNVSFGKNNDNHYKINMIIIRILAKGQCNRASFLSWAAVGDI
jgi:hypothetical protein